MSLVILTAVALVILVGAAASNPHRELPAAPWPRHDRVCTHGDCHPAARTQPDIVQRANKRTYRTPARAGGGAMHPG